MSRIGALKIHRAQRDKVLELYKNSLKNLDIGLNYILAPEGTRQESGELGEFKMGPFIMAISGQCPIYPVVIKGAYKIMPKHSIFPSWGLWSSRVEVHVLPPILTKGKSLEDKIAIKEEVRKKMLDLLKVSSGPLDG